MVMTEAMACGTPVIAWPNGSVPEAVADGETASSWPPERPARLTALAPGYRADPPEAPTVSEFDEQFLHRHAMARSADHRPG
jgi:glycosyltransferase involved in cell wall biosynthesis